jgi:cytidylate kinase
MTERDLIKLVNRMAEESGYSGIDTGTMYGQFALDVGKAAAAAERERCAKLCDPTNADRPDDWTEYAKAQAECAERIRLSY